MKKSIAIITALVMLISLLQVGMVSADEVVTPEPITVTASVASGATVFSGDKIELTFSEPISEESLAGITVSGDVTPAFKNVEPENTKVEITVPETAGALTIAVAAEVGNETNTVAEAKTFTYNVVNLLFDMELDAPDGTTSGDVNDDTIKVKATDKTSDNLRTNTETGEKWALTTEEAHASNVGRPVYHNENGLEYLTFRRYEKTTNISRYARVVVPMDSTLDIANQDALTFETWIRPNTWTEQAQAAYQWGFWGAVGKAPFVAWNSNTSASAITNNAFSLSWRKYIVGVNTTYDGIYTLERLDQSTKPTIMHGAQNDLADTQKLGDMDEFEDKWVHIVITREYLGSNNWQSVLYVNGNKRTTVTNTFAKGSYTDYNDLIIGADARAENAFSGDISTFKLYNGVLDEDVIRQNYYDTCNKYYYTGPDKISKVLDVKVEDGAIVASSDADAPAPKRLSKELQESLKESDGSKPVTDPELLTDGDINYMSFARFDGETLNDTKARLIYKLNDIEFADKDEITVTAWARMPYTKEIASQTSYTRRTTMFSLGGFPKAGTSKNIFRATLIPNNNAENPANSMMAAYIDSAGVAATDPKTELGDIAAYGDDWAHYAITKTWVGNSGSPTNGKFVFKFYVNGAFVYKNEIAVANRKDWSETTGKLKDPDSADYIVIGGMSSDTKFASFFGDIAHFTLYSGGLDAAQVAADYYATCAPFVDSDVLGTLTMQGGAPLTAGNIDQATEVNIDGLILKDMGENEPVVFLAVYGDEDSTKLIGVALADITVADGQIKFNAKVDGLTQGTAKHVKALVWDGFSSIRPLTDAVSCL